MILYFTYESRGTLMSFTLFVTVKTISKLNAKQSDKYEIKVLKFSHREFTKPRRQRQRERHQTKGLMS